MAKIDAPLYDAAENHILFSEFVRYLDGVGMKHDCPQCGAHGQWGIFTEHDGEDPQLSIWKMSAAPTPHFRTFASMWCTNCGSTRNVLVSAIKEWLEKEGENGKSE